MKMAIYIEVPVREDRLAEVFKLLSSDPLDREAEPTQAADKRDSTEPAVPQAARDDERWDAFWSLADNVRKHVAHRSDRIRAINRAIAKHAEEGRWITTDDIGADNGDSPSSVASALGPYARYLENRNLRWPFRWRYGSDNRIEYQMAPAVAAVMLEIL
jgi:hypothetical protein